MRAVPAGGERRKDTNRKKEKGTAAVRQKGYSGSPFIFAGLFHFWRLPHSVSSYIAGKPPRTPVLIFPLFQITKIGVP